jgi:hypothetical protein
VSNGKTVTVKYPKHVKIGAKRYKIHWSAEDWINRPADDKPDSAWGLTDHKTLGMWINPELHIMNRRETLLHEILHILHACSGGDVVSEMLPKHEHSSEAEEFIVSRLEAPMFAWMIDNPAVVAFIMIGADEDRS